MNRIDRLTGMILLLQSRRVITAEEIAAHFEISVRTVYRDIAALGEAGVPIMAEAGVGYSLARGYHMPPVMFTEDEAAALVIGAEVTEQVADDSLKRSIGGALLKIRSVLTADRRDYVARLERSVNVHFGRPGRPGTGLMPIQEAIVRRRCLALRYDAGRRGEITERVVEPLGVVFYNRHWHLIAWCRLRRALRDFRLDRVESWRALTETFDGHADFSMEEFVRQQTECVEMTPATLVVARDLLEKFRAEAPSPPVREEALADGRVRIEILSFAPEYLIGWLLGFGARVEAEYPPELRERLRVEALAVANLYSGISS
jgi:predicted DNA-binding transcriptional regulator YafY